jgi:hypothetical protein
MSTKVSLASSREKAARILARAASWAPTDAACCCTVAAGSCRWVEVGPKSLARGLTELSEDCGESFWAAPARTAWVPNMGGAPNPEGPWLAAAVDLRRRGGKVSSQAGSA